VNNEELSEIDIRMLQKWGNEERAYNFIKEEFQVINKTCFNDELPELEIEIRPMFAREGDILFGSSSAGAEYYAKDSVMEARIVLYSVALLEEELAVTVLAHEMVHYWEDFTKNLSAEYSYPEEFDQIISQHFKDGIKQQSWRNGHSRRFLGKISEVAETLKLSSKRILYDAK